MTEPEVVFYDGACGLCHRSVRFFLLRDDDARFLFAPLGGETYRATYPATRQATSGVGGDAEAAPPPESVIVRTRDGRTLVRSDATVHLLRAIGGGWGVVGTILRIVPRPLRDLGYRAVARVRRHLFAAPKSACPVLPADLRGRIRT